MKILVTGIGVSGKSSFCRSLFKKYQKAGRHVEHFDADGFQELRNQADSTCLSSLPDNFHPDIVYIIEDVHATLDNAVLPLSAYDLIFYVRPNYFNYLLFWHWRATAWFKSGEFSWEKESGWHGSLKNKDWRNLIPISREFIRHLLKRRAWLKDDYKKLSPFNFHEVRPFIKRGEICFKCKT